MFVRKKKNKSGSVSIQIIDKSTGVYRVVKTVGNSKDAEQIERLFQQAYHEIPRITGQYQLKLHQQEEQTYADNVFNSIQNIYLQGPEILLGKIFDQIGFCQVNNDLFRHLVITRLVYPVSKLKTIDYLNKHKGIKIEKDKVYRYLDRLNKKHKQQVEQISYRHTLSLLNDRMSVVFYDVTTIYFESEDEDDLRKTGFSKDGKHRNPQIVLGLLVSVEGYPLAYEIFEGNKFEGHTMLPVVETFTEKYKLEKPIVVADAGLLSARNINDLQSKGYRYILGARIKNEAELVKRNILSLKLKSGESAVIQKDEKTRLIISYSFNRARKDAANRKKGLEKLERLLATGKLGKKHINNRGYNKYLKLEGEINIKIDYEKYRSDAQWDGLKGYYSNTSISREEIIANYRQLWQIEKAFRISKTDLRIRPVFHRLKHRIEAHICIAFCAYKVYKELERQLREKGSDLSPEKAIDILKTIYAVTVKIPGSDKCFTKLILRQNEQINLLKLFGM